MPEALWVMLCLIGLVIIVTRPRWAAITFYLIWTGLALLLGLRAMLAHRRLAADDAAAAASAENTRLLAAQRRFLAEASHQLKTPITIALGHAELLAARLAGQDSRRDIHVVVGELNRLKRLSERLLLIAAAQNPDFLRPEPVDLGLFATDLLRRWRPTASRRWLIGQLDDVTVPADPDRLRLAIDALLENAVQHTADDDRIRVSVTCAPRARFACVAIEDSGVGIAPAELARIFDRFSAGTRAAGGRGTGLGLPLAQAIARGHGGEIRVHSKPGEGSTFEVTLPAPAAGAPGPGPVVTDAVVTDGAVHREGVR